jgi:protocatechuate 3,4-dioxygenase beta subunit
MALTKSFWTLAAGLLVYACPAQQQLSESPIADRPVGGPCEGCEALYEVGELPLHPIDTLPGFGEYEPKLRLEGTVFEKDGRTPAAGIILYVYQTGPDGIYQLRGNETGWARRHGMYRGWVKTGQDGRYAFYTFRPGAYPNRTDPVHIHLTVKEPGLEPYYLDDFLFDDDPRLTKAERNHLPDRGGSGIVRPIVRNGLQAATRNLILGRNIPGYPN